MGDAGVAGPGAAAGAAAAAAFAVAPDVSVAERLPAFESWVSKLWRAVIAGTTAPSRCAADDEPFHILEWVAKHGTGAYAAYEHRRPNAEPAGPRNRRRKAYVPLRGPPTRWKQVGPHERRLRRLQASLA
jgi:hypothetical protein